MVAITPLEKSLGCCTLKPPAQAVLVAEDSSLNHTLLLQYFNLKRSSCNSDFFVTLARTNLLYFLSEQC